MYRVSLRCPLQVWDANSLAFRFDEELMGLMAQAIDTSSTNFPNPPLRYCLLMKSNDIVVLQKHAATILQKTR